MSLSDVVLVAAIFLAIGVLTAFVSAGVIGEADDDPEDYRR